MDPNAPRPQRDPEAVARLETVQRRVVSVLIMTTIAHLTGGMILAAVTDVAGDRAGAQIGLILIGSIFFAVGVTGVLALNKRPLRSWWYLTALIPFAIGMWLCFG